MGDGCSRWRLALRWVGDNETCMAWNGVGGDIYAHNFGTTGEVDQKVKFLEFLSLACVLCVACLSMAGFLGPGWENGPGLRRGR